MFGKSQFKDEQGQIVPSKIERKVKEFFSFNRIDKSVLHSYQIGNLLLSEARDLAEYFGAEERKEKYQIKIIGQLDVGRVFFDRDNLCYRVEVYLRGHV